MVTLRPCRGQQRPAASKLCQVIAFYSWYFLKSSNKLLPIVITCYDYAYLTSFSRIIFTDRPTDRPIDPTDRQTDRQNDRQTKRPTDQMTDRLSSDAHDSWKSPLKFQRDPDPDPPSRPATCLDILKFVSVIMTDWHKHLTSDTSIFNT